MELQLQAPGREGQARRGYSGRSFPLPPSQKTGRVAVLEPFIQQTCTQTASLIAAQLARHLASLPPADHSHEGIATVEQALLLGGPPCSAASVRQPQSYRNSR